jgi:hypothetical protein
LLTPAPLECLNDELYRIAHFGSYFHAIAVGIVCDLKTDRRSAKLIAALKKFCLPMHFASEEISYTFHFSYDFYLNSREERRGSWHEPGPITQARVAKLLEPDWQAKAIENAHRAASQAAKAATALREQALPLLQQLELELNKYVMDYGARATLIEKRKKSWMPSVLQNALWGAIKPLPWTNLEVQTYPSHLLTAKYMLCKLPMFLDNMELHYRRLSELDSQQILEYGYTTPKDLTRLFNDRILCQYAVEQMMTYWYSSFSAIAIGLPGDKP